MRENKKKMSKKVTGSGEDNLMKNAEKQRKMLRFLLRQTLVTFSMPFHSFVVFFVARCFSAEMLFVLSCVGSLFIVKRMLLDS